jgi:hypothetical protein
VPAAGAAQEARRERHRLPSLHLPNRVVREHLADARAAFVLPADASVADAPRPFAPSEGESVTTYRGGSLRNRGGSFRKSIGWKKYALATGLVFALAMVTVTVGELIMGKPVAAAVRNEQGRGTSVGGGSTGSRGPADSVTPTPGASSGSAPQTGGSASPDASEAPDTSSGPGPSRSPASSPSASRSPASSSSHSASASSGPSGSGAVSSSDVTGQ